MSPQDDGERATGGVRREYPLALRATSRNFGWRAATATLMHRTSVWKSLYADCRDWCHFAPNPTKGRKHVARGETRRRHSKLAASRGHRPARTGSVHLQQVILDLIINAVEAMSGRHRAARITDQHLESRTGGARGVAGFGPGLAPATLGTSSTHSNDQAQRFGAGAVDLPFDHRSARGGGCRRARTYPAAPFFNSPWSRGRSIGAQGATNNDRMGGAATLLLSRHAQRIGAGRLGEANTIPDNSAARGLRANPARAILVGSCRTARRMGAGSCEANHQGTGRV